MSLIGFISIAVMGFTLGLMGAGGSILAVPILVYLFKLPAAEATFYSLFVVGLSAAIGATPFALQKRIKYKQALIFFVPSLVGVLAARRLLLPLLPESNAKNLIILFSFALVMLAASLTMLFKKNPPPPLETKTPFAKTLAGGFIIGTITGFVGVGGGFLIIPALVGSLNIPMSHAVGTSMLIIAINALFGFFSDWAAGTQVPWGFIAKLSIFSLIGIAAGTYANRLIPAAKLKIIFGWFVLILGSFILINQIVTLF